MFIKAFLDTKIADGITYRSVIHLINSMVSILRISVANVMDYLVAHPRYIDKLIK